MLPKTGAALHAGVGLFANLKHKIRCDLGELLPALFLKRQNDLRSSIDIFSPSDAVCRSGMQAFANSIAVLREWSNGVTDHATPRRSGAFTGASASTAHLNGGKEALNLSAAVGCGSAVS